MVPGCAFMPPGRSATTRSWTRPGCPYGDPTQPPDIEAAQAALEEAGEVGTEVTVWGNNDDPTDKVTQAYADMLNEIGFDATPKIIDGGVYFQTIGNEKTAAQTGFANWFLDWPHPLNLWFLVDPDSIQPTNNQNYGNVDDPEIKDELDRLNLETGRRGGGRGLAGARRVPGRAAAELHRSVGPPEARDVPVGEDGLGERRVPPGVLQRLHHVRTHE